MEITLRAARISTGLTLKQVAQIVGKHPRTIAKYELDSSKIPRDVIEALVGVYRVPKQNIFFGKESVFTEQFKAMCS